MYDDVLIEGNDNEELFSEDKPYISFNDFNPPPVIQDENSILGQTPIIKITTPIRRKASPVKDDFLEPSFPDIGKHQKKINSPVPDYNDNDIINSRVKKLISSSQDISYDDEHEIVKEGAMEAFIIKYQNMSINYPEHNIIFPDGKSLNTIHKHYHEIIKSIYVNMNLGQTQLGYILGLMVLEFICVKALNLPMAGFTKMELKRMYKYNSLMIELGESMYTTAGGEPSPVEWRIASTFFWNIVIFLGIKIISNYVGGENMIDMVRNVIDKIMDNPITPENIETGEAKNINNNQGDIGDMFGGLFGGNSDGTSEISELISTLGTSFTEKMESNKKSNKKNSENKSRFIFNG